MRGNVREIEKCRSDLCDMLKLPENRYCADCGSKQPTWASTNIGVFVCIRCSGIHRNLGTHISKVKSTTLDSWTSRLLQQFKAQGGNIAVNLCYESRLPKHEKPTESTDTYRLEQFIRMKYATRKWFDPPKPPPQVNKVQPEKEKEKKVTPPVVETKPQVRNVVVNKTPVKPVPPKKPVKEVPDLLPREMLASNNEPEDLLSFMQVSENSNIKPTNVQNNKIATEKANVSTGVSGFGFINASNGVNSTTITTPTNSQPGKLVTAAVVKPIQPPKLNNNNNDSINLMDSPQAKNSKDSILSMYKQQPLLQQMGPKTSEAFMTQLPPNMGSFAPTQKPPTAQMGLAAGHNVAMGFNGTFNPQLTSNNPYTMLNNQSNQPLF